MGCCPGVAGMRDTGLVDFHIPDTTCLRDVSVMDYFFKA